jgi:hypothetical protein
MDEAGVVDPSHAARLRLLGDILADPQLARGGRMGTGGSLKGGLT